MNPHFANGDIMLIDDHINLMGGNPLVGINDDQLGPALSRHGRGRTTRVLIDAALEIARRENFAAHKGVFVAVLGPNLETRAEYRFLRLIGADAVGMSTVPEVIVAVHCGLRVLGCSIITDMCLPDALEPVDIEQIIATAKGAEPKLRKIILGILANEFSGSPAPEQVGLMTADRQEQNRCRRQRPFDRAWPERRPSRHHRRLGPVPSSPARSTSKRCSTTRRFHISADHGPGPRPLVDLRHVSAGSPPWRMDGRFHGYEGLSARPGRLSAST